MLTHLFGRAREAGCAKLLLDTPVTNVRGHRYYERQGLAAGALRSNIAITRQVRRNQRRPPAARSIRPVGTDSPFSSNSSASFSVMAPPSSSASMIVTARR